MYHIILLLTGITCFFSLFAAYLSYFSATAHETFQFGDMNIEPGWEIEPPLEMQLNSIEVSVTSDPQNEPVANAFSDLTAIVKFGGVTKPLDLQPTEEAGVYRAKIIPSQVGSYSLNISGTIRNESLVADLPIEDVESTTKFTFPPTPGISPNNQESSLLQSKQLALVVSDLTNQLEKSRDLAQRAMNTSMNADNSIKELEVSIDNNYVLLMIAIGLGIGGIIIGAVGLNTRRLKR